MGLWDDSGEGQRHAGEREMARFLLNDFQMDCFHWRDVLLVNMCSIRGLVLMRKSGLLCGKLDNINFNMPALPFNVLLEL